VAVVGHALQSVRDCDGARAPERRAGRFRELSRAISGIGDSVLSDRLSDLVEGGLIVRTVDEKPPISVSYALTDRGRALMPALDQIALWAEEHVPADGC
jgi:DNA-binding HxlR family transcriptional regulator